MRHSTLLNALYTDIDANTNNKPNDLGWKLQIFDFFFEIPLKER